MEKEKIVNRNGRDSGLGVRVQIRGNKPAVVMTRMGEGDFAAFASLCRQEGITPEWMSWFPCGNRRMLAVFAEQDGMDGFLRKVQRIARLVRGGGDCPDEQEDYPDLYI